MSTEAYPFEGQSTTEAQYSRLFRELQDSGVVGGYGGTDLAVTASNGNAVISPGMAILRGFAFRTDANITLTPSAVQSGDAQRIDAVVLHLDPTTDSISATLVPGSVSAAPALVQTDTGIYELLLATVTISSSGSLTVVDRRTYVGGRFGYWDTSTRPTAPRKGTHGYNKDLGYAEMWSGTTWVSLAVNWAAIAGKPATFAPSAHTHDFDDLTNNFRRLVYQITADQVLDGYRLKTANVTVPANTRVCTRVTGVAGDPGRGVNVGIDTETHSSGGVFTAGTSSRMVWSEAVGNAAISFVGVRDVSLAQTITVAVDTKVGSGRANFYVVVEIDVIPGGAS